MIDISFYLILTIVFDQNCPNKELVANILILANSNILAIEF